MANVVQDMSDKRLSVNHVPHTNNHLSRPSSVGPSPHSPIIYSPPHMLPTPTLNNSQN